MIGEGLEWCAQGDDFRTFLGDFVATFPQTELYPGLSLQDVREHREDNPIGSS
jgi:hypothetical protein